MSNYTVSKDRAGGVSSPNTSDADPTDDEIAAMYGDATEEESLRAPPPPQQPSLAMSRGPCVRWG